MIKKFFILLIFGLLFFSFSFADKPEADKKDGKNKLNKTSTNSDYAYFDGNSILMWISNNGDGSNNPNDGGQGFIWPKGTGRGAIFEDGLIYGGVVGGQIRVGGSAYRHGWQSGKIINGVADDPTNSKYKIYKIQKGWEQLPAGTVKSALEQDYLNWPGDDGAPFTDVNGNGLWDPGIDLPKFIGDQQLWFVSNDMDPGKTTFLYGTQPLGLEIQCLTFGFNVVGPLYNCVFKKYTIINKGHYDIDGMYLSYWSDTDLGNAADDGSGCDTVLSLAYTYNRGATDLTYGAACPADGYVYLQGPCLKSDNPNDQANWNFGKKKGYKNLPMTAFTVFINGGPAEFLDPAQGVPNGAAEFYFMMLGVTKWNNPMIDPNGHVSTYMFSGDPVKGTGWLIGDGRPSWNTFGPNDMRHTQSSGPFKMLKGDTQEVVMGIVIGQGADRLSSITVLKNYVKTAQKTYNQAFNLPQPPAQPNVTVAKDPNSITLYWADAASVQRTEVPVVKSDTIEYHFEGYNVYQLPSASAIKSQATRVATFDIVNDVKTILDKSIDNVSGVELNLPVQYGGDNGLKYYFTFDHDYISGGAFIPGQTYYFAVTAYSYSDQPDAVPNNLENTISVISVVPQVLNPGYRVSSKSGDQLSFTKTGLSDGVMQAIVIDPKKTTGDTYTVSFDTAGGSLYWKVVDKTKNTTVVSSWTNQSGDDQYPIFDGILLKVTGPTLTGLRRDDDAEGKLGIAFPDDAAAPVWGGTYRFFNPQNWTDLGLQAFGPGRGGGEQYSWGWPAIGISWFSNTTVTATQLKKVEIRFTSDQTKWSKGYRYLRHANTAITDPAYTPFIINKLSGYRYQDFVNMPCTVWDIDATPARQLAIGFMENNDVKPLGNCDGKWRPTADVSAGREFFFIFNTNYSATALDKYAKSADGKEPFDILSNQTDMMYCGLVVQRAANRPFPNDSGATGINVRFQLIPYYPNNQTTTFTFTAPAPMAYSADTANLDINNINVFPNPYFGFNSYEINKAVRFITFSHLPKRATLKIFTLSGTLVRVLEKDDDNQYFQWNLRNANQIPVASGMYLIYIDMPDLGKKKTLKVAIILEAQIIDRI